MSDIRDQPTVTVAIPLYNEEQSIPELLSQVSDVLAKLPGDQHEILCINDGSTDSTLERLIARRHEYPHLRIVDLSRNFGHQAAVTAALDHARGDVILIMDGDLQDDPALLPEFLDEYHRGADVVYAKRTNRPEGGLRKLGYSVHYRLLATISDSPVQMDSGDFALLSRRAAELISSLPERQRYVRGLRAWIGLRQVGIDVDRRERYAGSSKYSLRDLVALSTSGLFAFSKVPLRIASILGLVTVVAGLGYALFALLSRILGQPPQGFSTLALLQVGFSGVLLLVLGVIGEYVGRIYDEVKHRPVYIVGQVWEQGERDG